MRDHSYQQVRTEEDAGVDGIPLHAPNKSSGEFTEPFISRHGRTPARSKPSVYRLLPYFFLSSLAFGLTMVPRLNVLVTLICRQMTNGGVIAGTMNSARHEMPAGMTHGGGTSTSDMSQNVTGAAVSMASSMGSSDGTCSSPEVLASVAFMSTYRDLTTGIIGAVTSYYLGRLSDRIGRRKVMVMNGIGILVAELILLLVVAFPDSVDYRWLFLSFIVDGLSGSFPLLMAVASSYVTDTTSGEDRVVAMGWIQSGMFCGMAVGPALGGALSSLSGPDKPAAIWLYSMLCRALALLCLTVLPESLSNASRDGKIADPHGHSSPWSLGSIKSMLSFGAIDALLDPEGSLAESRRTRRNLVLLMAINAVMFGTSIGAMDVMMLYPQAQFKWTMMDTGNFISIINIFRTLSTAVVLRLLMRLLTRNTPLESSNPDQDIKRTHLPLLRLALCSDIVGYIGWGVAPSGAFFTIAGILSALSAMGISASQASMSMLVSVEHVGKLMGILGSIQALTRLVSPPIINLAYAWTVSFLPQGVFFGLAATVGVAVMMTYLMRH
jgi:MFS family permease